MRSWMTLLAGCLLISHSILMAMATCPAVSIETRKTVVSNRKMHVRVKMKNPNPKQPLNGVALSVVLPANVVYVSSRSSRSVKHTAPSQNGQVLSWSNLYLKRAMYFNIKVNVTESAYNAAGTPIVFNAQSSMATPCTVDAEPESVKVKQSKRAKKGAKNKPNIIFFIVDGMFVF